jgi:hypothetical protein
LMMDDVATLTQVAPEGVSEAVHVEGVPTVAVPTELQATILEPAPLVIVAPPVTTLVTKRTTVDWIIDYAKTDRCECHRSGEVIGRNELRVMRRNTASTGFQMAYSYKVIPFFQMMSRMAAATSKPATVAGLIGFGELSAADQEMLANLFRRYQDSADDFPPSEAKGQCAAAIRKHRRPQLERRFLCPAPGCTKAYSSAGCLSQHKRDKHPELLRGRLRGPGDSCPPASLALAPPQGSVATTALTLIAIPASLVPPPPDHQPQAAVQGMMAPPVATATASCVSSLEAGGGCRSYGGTSAQPIMQAQHVLPQVMPAVMPAVLAPNAHAEPPRLAGYEHEAPQPPRKLLCPAPGCGKAYACSSSLYVHKRNKHPELIRPRGNQALRPEMASVELVGAELMVVGAEVSQMAGVEMAGVEMAGVEMAGVEMAGVEMASISVEIAGAEMASAEVLAGEVLAGEVYTVGAGADMVGVEGMGGGGMGAGVEMVSSDLASSAMISPVAASADAEMASADAAELAGALADDAMAGAEGMGGGLLGAGAEMASSLAASAEMTSADDAAMACAERMGGDAVYGPG